MAKVEIRGKEFPLCLTVAALDQVNEKCGSLDGINAFLFDCATVSETYRNTAWLLALLMEEGEKNRQVCELFDGNQTEKIQVPTCEQLCSMISFHSMLRLRLVCLNAIGESLNQDIEATHLKNAEHAERE